MVLQDDTSTHSGHKFVHPQTIHAQTTVLSLLSGQLIYYTKMLSKLLSYVTCYPQCFIHIIYIGGIDYQQARDRRELTARMRGQEKG